MGGQKNANECEFLFQYLTVFFLASGTNPTEENLTTD